MKYLFLILTLFLFSCSYITEKKNEEVDLSQKKVILALGDSLTAGYGLDIKESYTSKLQKILDAKGYNYELINAGVSGDTSANILSRSDLYLEKNPNIVILVVGGNDGLRGLSTIELKKNILGIIDTFTGSTIVLGGMDIPINLGIEYKKEFKKIYLEISNEKKDIYILESFLEGVGGNPKYNISDMIHPNSEGYDIIVENLMKFFEENKIIIK